MANRTWLGRAQAVAQVVTLTPGGTIEVGDVFNVSINGKTVSYVATGTTVASVTAGLAAALAAMTDAEFTEVTWSDETTHVQGEGVTAGKPFELTVATTESGGGAADDQTFTLATTIEATGPNHADNAQNWGGTLPSGTDSFFLANSNVSILYGLDAFAAVTPALIDVDASYTGFIGLPETNAAGYPEYRPKYLQFAGATACRIGVGAGQGSRRIRIDFGSTAFTASVFKSGAAQSGIPAILLKGTAATNALEVNGGSVGVAIFGDETSTIKTLGVSGGSLVMGDGVTLNGTDSTAVVSGGEVTARTVFLSLNAVGGTVNLVNTGGATTLAIHPQARCLHRGSGASTSVSLAGLLDLSGDNSALNLGTLTYEPGGRLAGITHRSSLTVTFARGDLVREIVAA